MRKKDVSFCNSSNLNKTRKGKEEQCKLLDSDVNNVGFEMPQKSALQMF